MYFPSFNALNGQLVRMNIMPMQAKRFQPVHATPRDKQWLLKTLSREGKQFGTELRLQQDGSFRLIWNFEGCEK